MREFQVTVTPKTTKEKSSDPSSELDTGPETKVTAWKQL